MQPAPFSRREIADVVPSISAASDIMGDNRNRRVKTEELRTEEFNILAD
jgi:hypothetical protein